MLTNERIKKLCELIALEGGHVLDPDWEERWDEEGEAMGLTTWISHCTNEDCDAYAVVWLSDGEPTVYGTVDFEGEVFGTECPADYSEKVWWIYRYTPDGGDTPIAVGPFRRKCTAFAHAILRNVRDQVTDVEPVLPEELDAVLEGGERTEFCL